MGSSDAAGWLNWAVDTVLDFSADFLAFIVVAVIIAAFAFYFGRNRIVPLMAGLYAAIPLYLYFPWTEFLTTPVFAILLYLGFAVIGMVAFAGLGSYIASDSMGIIPLIVLSAVMSGMLLAISIHVLPVEEIYSFSAPTKALFETQQSFFLWLAAPLVGVFFFGK
jgi:hypothetical protein